MIKYLFLIIGSGAIYLAYKNRDTLKNTADKIKNNEYKDVLGLFLTDNANKKMPGASLNTPTARIVQSLVPEDADLNNPIMDIIGSIWKKFDGVR